MSEYLLKEVVSKQDRREFLDLPKRLYANEPNWICPLDGDIEAPFDASVNNLLANGEAVRFMVSDSFGEVVGRIAAFYNRDAVATNPFPVGGCGFFESIDNKQVAHMLFDAAKSWLEVRGMEAMDGPINFGDRDAWWGLLVKGFEFTPLYTNPYNFEYYKELFESYGFQIYFNQHTYLRELKMGLFPDTVYERYNRLLENPSYSFRSISKSNLDQHALEFMEVYNKAWAKFNGVNPIDEHHARELMRKMRPIIDEKIMIFAYYDDRPIGFYIMVPDLNGVIHPLKGKFGWLEKLRFIYRLKVSRKADRIFAIIFGVIPEFQGKGIESGLICFFEQLISSKDFNYKSLELAWIGDFNPVMMRMVETMVCAKKHKMHITYRYLFDREKPFERAPRMGVTRS